MNASYPYLLTTEKTHLNGAHDMWDNYKNGNNYATDKIFDNVVIDKVNHHK